MVDQTPAIKAAEGLAALVEATKGRDYLSRCEIKVDAQNPRLVNVRFNKSDQCYFGFEKINGVIQGGKPALERFIEEERVNTLKDHPGWQYGY